MDLTLEFWGLGEALGLEVIGPLDVIGGLLALVEGIGGSLALGGLLALFEGIGGSYIRIRDNFSMSSLSSNTRRGFY